MGERITKTRRVILEAARGHDRGWVAMGVADRQGTRIVGHIDGVPVVRAYSSPERELTRRGLIKSVAGYTYEITDAGRAALGAPAGAR